MTNLLSVCRHFPKSDIPTLYEARVARNSISRYKEEQQESRSYESCKNENKFYDFVFDDQSQVFLERERVLFREKIFWNSISFICGTKPLLYTHTITVINCSLHTKLTQRQKPVASRDRARESQVSLSRVATVVASRPNLLPSLEWFSILGFLLLRAMAVVTRQHHNHACVLIATWTTTP